MPERGVCLPYGYWFACVLRLRRTLLSCFAFYLFSTYAYLHSSDVTRQKSEMRRQTFLLPTPPRPPYAKCLSVRVAPPRALYLSRDHNQHMGHQPTIRHRAGAPAAGSAVASTKYQDSSARPRTMTVVTRKHPMTSQWQCFQVQRVREGAVRRMARVRVVASLPHPRALSSLWRHLCSIPSQS